MTLTRLTLATVVLTTLTITACATMQVNSYVERGVDMTRYRTYAWAPPDTQSTGDPRLDNNEFFRGRIQTQVDRRLNNLGFEMTTAAPDLVVHYHASVAQEVNANAVDSLHTSCENCEPFVYDAGTIVIDLMDARSRRLVWRGWAEGSVDGAMDSQVLMERQIDEAIARIMQRLPRRL